MKILLVSLYGRGGMTHYSSQIAKALVNDNDVALVAPTHIKQEYFDANINFKLIKSPYSFTLTLFYTLNIFIFLDLLRFVKCYNPDIIHFLNDHPWNNVIMIILKYKTVLTCHDPIQHIGERNKLVMYLFKLNALYQFKRVDKIIVHGKSFIKDLTRQNIKSEKIVVIPHGDYAFFAKSPKSEIKEDGSVLFFGRIKLYKGIRYLIEAEPMISKIISNYKLIIAGEGDISPYIKYIKNKRKFLIINKYITDPEVAVLFRKASVVVLPYIEASQSGIIPIAYAFKKPVVVTNVGSIPEVVDDGITGFIVPPKDPEALASAITKILRDDKLRKEMGDSAYRKMEKELSWDKIAVKTIENYKEILDEHKNRRGK